jgi:hypothetical protein
VIREATRPLWSSRLWLIAITALVTLGLGAAPAGADLVSAEKPVEVVASATAPAEVTETAPSAQPPPAPPVEAETPPVEVESTTPPTPVSAPSTSKVPNAAPTSLPVSTSTPDLNVPTQHAIPEAVTKATEPVTDAVKQLPETDAGTRLPGAGEDLVEAARQLSPLDTDVPIVVGDLVNDLGRVPLGAPVEELADEIAAEPVAGTTPPVVASLPGAAETLPGAAEIVTPDDSSRILDIAARFRQAVLDPVGAPIDPQGFDATPASASGGIRSRALHLHTAGGMATSALFDRAAEFGGPEAPAPMTPVPAPSPIATSGSGGPIFVPIAALLALLALSVPAILRRLREVGSSAPGPLVCALERPG